MFQATFGLALAYVLVLSCAGELPHYIKTCAIGDPYFKECFIRHANGAIPYLFKYGSKHFDMLQLSPFVVDKVTFSARDDFTLVLTNMNVLGLEGLKMIDANLDWDKNKLDVTFKSPLIEWTTEYKMEGTLFDRPISGFGKANFSYVEPISKYSAEINTVEIDGKIHYELTNSVSDYDNDKVVYKFENLYDGDEEKSKEMHTLMNGDWAVLRKELKEETDKIIVGFYGMVFDSVFKYASAEEIFIKQSPTQTVRKEL